ncbi:hypothetical protein FB451DRAFT_1365977 [Mycena latifolia]|nr:hypothetical protein FB451DRAFT_1365977 [Mycena latifolia]
MPASNDPTRPSQRPAPPVILSDAGPKQNAFWTDPDIKFFLEFLIENIASVGDGGNFKMPIFTRAYPKVNEIRTLGGLKSAKSCHGKYASLRATFAVVDHIKNHASGFTWDPTYGANIDAKPFRNKGWVWLEQMEKLVPSQAKGAHVFRTGEAVTLQEDDEPDGTPAPAPGFDGMGSPPWSIEGDDDGGKGEEDKEEGEQENEEPRTSSPTPYRTPAPSGRKRAASPTPATRTIRPKRTRLSGGAQALGDIASSAADFIDIFGDFRTAFTSNNTTAPAAAAAPANPVVPAAVPHAPVSESTPSRKKAAVVRAQALEIYLLDDDLATLIDILSMNTAKADAYNAIVRDGVRVAWVQEQLRKHMAEQGLQLPF